MKTSLLTSAIFAVILLASCSKEPLLSPSIQGTAIHNLSTVKTNDSLHPVILFGSSSVTPAKWKDVPRVFEKYYVQQLGFGGATMGTLYNLEDTGHVVSKYNPAIILLWCGDNDIKGTRERGGKFYAADLLWTWKRTFTKLRERNPAATIVGMQIKNSPATSQLFESDGRTLTIDSSNTLLEKFLSSQTGTAFIKINDNLKGRAEYYQSDSFHLSPLAYTNVINPKVLAYLDSKYLSVPPVDPAPDTTQPEPPKPPVNKLPIVKPGDPITIHLSQGINRVTLDGTRSLDPDGKIVKFDWSKIRGPKADMYPFATGKTYAAHLVRGDYLFQLKVTDNKGATNAAARAVYVK